MKRWAIITVVLYGAILLLLTVPLILGYGLRYAAEQARWELDPGFGTAIEIYQQWGYWLWLAVLLAGQALLLLVPIDLARKRPTARRRLLVPVVTAAFFLGNIVLAGVFDILCAILGDDASKVIEGPADFSKGMADLIPPFKAALAQLGGGGSGLFAFLTILSTVLMFWLVWGLIFYHFAKADEPDTLVRRFTRWLLRGSIVELLVAVPCHIVVRSRGDCCAPAVTFWGIVTGVSVALMSFGPGVYFLFVARMRRLQPGPPPVNLKE